MSKLPPYPPRHTQALRDLLANVATIILQQLELRYVGVTVGSAAGKIQARAGTPGTESRRFPLRVQDESVGWLEVCHPEGVLDAEAHRVLETLAEQVALIVMSLQRSAELHVAQQQLVTIREEERRRLQRTLHDGLGSTLGAQALVIGSARRLLERDPQRADELLSQLESDLHGILVQVRRVVYDLRPPDLDQFGLAEALRLKLRELANGRLRLEMLLPAASVSYPAAVEVAAYHIVLEAVSKVMCLEQIRSCTVSLKVTATALEIDIGVGGCLCDHACSEGWLSATRERAKELGGHFSVTPGTPDQPGVQVWASLPL